MNVILLSLPRTDTSLTKLRPRTQAVLGRRVCCTLWVPRGEAQGHGCTEQARKLPSPSPPCGPICRQNWGP